MLTSIPVISPIEVTLGEPTVRRLPAPPDYEVHALPPAAVLVEEAAKDPAIVALDEMEHATQISEYHDFSWWDERLKLLRARLENTD
jgi:hypothetical protein